MLVSQCNRCKWLVTAVAFMLIAGPQAVAAAEAPCSAEPYRVFDFWVGTWEVTGADGRRAGRNDISREQNGCVLVERWQGEAGNTGMSMNHYDPHKEHWRQLWVSPGIQIDITGGMTEAGMVLEGTIVYLAEGQARPFRGTWTPLPDGRVRQYFEEANDDGQWAPWFEGFYERMDGAPEEIPEAS